LQLSPVIADADAIPALAADCTPPLIHGTAALAHRAYDDHGLDDLLAFIDREPATPAEQAALQIRRPGGGGDAA